MWRVHFIWESEWIEKFGGGQTYEISDVGRWGGLGEKSDYAFGSK